ncbi:MAG: hypothetical protein M3Z22_08065 [Verrucomicrobiota bacterium]|nr:hypothetical protein [Verrucomicrobiota bacterium]
MIRALAQPFRACFHSFGARLNDRARALNDFAGQVNHLTSGVVHLANEATERAGGVTDSAHGIIHVTRAVVQVAHELSDIAANVDDVTVDFSERAEMSLIWPATSMTSGARPLTFRRKFDSQAAQNIRRRSPRHASPPLPGEAGKIFIFPRAKSLTSKATCVSKIGRNLRLWSLGYFSFFLKRLFRKSTLFKLTH